MVFISQQNSGNYPDNDTQCRKNDISHRVLKTPGFSFTFVSTYPCDLNEGQQVRFSGSERPSGVPFGFSKSRAAVKVGLTPDPWLVGAAHLGFYLMDTAEVPLFCHATKEWADRNALTRIGIAQFKRHGVPEIFSPESGTDYRFPVVHERDKPAQDISPLLLHPDIHIRYGWRNIRTKNPAAQSALFAGILFARQFFHSTTIHGSSLFPEIPADFCWILLMP